MASSEDAAREADQIVREVAAAPILTIVPRRGTPLWQCLMCDAPPKDGDVMRLPENHQPVCIWKRAREYVARMDPAQAG
jgi:hypothetical protein